MLELLLSRVNLVADFVKKLGYLGSARVRLVFEGRKLGLNRGDLRVHLSLLSNDTRKAGLKLVHPFLGSRVYTDDLVIFMFLGQNAFDTESFQTLHAISLNLPFRVVLALRVVGEVYIDL